MRRGKLLFVTGEFPPDPGGIGIQTYQDALWLQRLGWQVHVVAAQGRIADPAAVRRFNEDQPFPVLTTSTLSRRLVWQAVKANQPDLLLTGDLTSTWLSWQVHLLTRTPLVSFAIGSEFRRSGFWRHQVKRLIYRGCRHVIANSHFTLNRMREVGIFNPASTVVHPGASLPDVPSSHGAAVLKARYGLHDKRVLLTLGSVSERKGQSVVIRAMPTVLERYPNAHYVMAGNDRTAGTLQRLAVELGVQHAVTFTGIIDEQDKTAFYDLAEFCALTSRNRQDEVEGFGIVVLEAALCGRTTIGTRGTGVEETMIENVTGLLVPQDDPRSTAEAILRLLDEPALRERLAQEAQSRARETGHWEYRAVRLDQLLAALLR